MKIDSDFFKSPSRSKTIKERLLGRLTAACITGLLGVAILYMGCRPEWSPNDDVIIFTTLFGGVLLAVGIALFIIYFCGKKMLAKEIAAEEKQIVEGK